MKSHIGYPLLYKKGVRSWDGVPPVFRILAKILILPYRRKQICQSEKIFGKTENLSPQNLFVKISEFSRIPFLRIGSGS